MTSDHIHCCVVLGTVAAAFALVIANRKKASAPTALDAISIAASAPPAVTAPTLPKYATQNISPWGNLQMPFMPGASDVNTADTSDLEYGSYYSN